MTKPRYYLFGAQAQMRTRTTKQCSVRHNRRDNRIRSQKKVRLEDRHWATQLVVFLRVNSRFKPSTCWKEDSHKRLDCLKQLGELFETQVENFIDCVIFKKRRPLNLRASYICVPLMLLRLSEYPHNLSRYSCHTLSCQLSGDESV
ncbi:uncharacterized protein TNCV_1586101 [Trichonephila clavipes]|uniref:Uncharacterized protein n=1 Tax=Trichonephila clavipes TaxID=2585209 RepID=A0A8X6S9L7_TRICX|nr:uncharacterized protein TNCV_1586101 [Trichonephila clavipes]